MLENFKSIPERDRIIVALDCSAERARELAEMLQGEVTWVKIGMTLYYKEGPAIVQEFKEKGFKVFLDLKFYDIPHQVKGAALSAALTGADMLTMHASGGKAMMEAAVEGLSAEELSEKRIFPATLGITVLTSMSQDDLGSIGVEYPVEDQVLRLARLAKESGLTGVVASPKEATMLREALGENAYIVTPGVRPLWSAKGDQSRIMTPSDAFKAGSSHLVIGRPITGAKDPKAAFLRIVEEIENS